MIASLAATATHPLMDWTNNYGVRLLLPWNPRWFYGDFIFIVDPFIWLVLGGAAFLLTSKTWKHIAVWAAISLVPSYLVLVGPGSTRFAGEIIVRLLWIGALIVIVTLYRKKIGGHLGSRIAVAALAIVTVYCAGLAGVHSVALSRAKVEASGLAYRNAEKFMRVAAMPTAANPAHWVCVTETDRATYRFNLSLLPGRTGITELVRFEKPAPSNQAIVRAEHDSRAVIFLGFARFPVVRALGEDCLTQTLVQFADLRYTEPGQGRGTFSLEVPVDCPQETTRIGNEQR
jgi:inner membrane protein